MGFFFGIFDWFVGVAVGVLSLVGVSVTPSPTCTMDLSAERLVWSAEEATDVTITALTSSPSVPGASQTLPEAEDPKPYNGDFNALKGQYPETFVADLRAHGVPGASFTPGTPSFIDGFYADKATADRICVILFPGSTNGTYAHRTYKSPKNNTVLIWNGSSWRQENARGYNRHIQNRFSCVRDVPPQDIPSLSGTHVFTPPLSVGTHTYRLIAQGPGGTETCEASVTVTDHSAAGNGDGSGDNGGSDADGNGNGTGAGSGGSGTGQGGGAGSGDNGDAGAAQCADSVDNDGDGTVDYPDDPGCASAADTTEAPNPQCADGIDNNGDGFIDYPEDPSCASVRGPVEEPIPDASLSLIATASLGLVQQGTTTQLDWTAAEVTADSCTIAGSDGTSWSLSGGEGSIETAALENETDFTLQCTDRRGDVVSVSVTVKIVPSFDEI